MRAQASFTWLRSINLHVAFDGRRAETGRTSDVAGKLAMEIPC
jgi:hypothetical protein